MQFCFAREHKMGNSLREFKQRNIGSKFGVVSVVSRLRTGLAKSTAIATAEMEDGIIILNLSAASQGVISTGTLYMDGFVLKNFPYKFEIVDAWMESRVAKATTNLKISLNPTSQGVPASVLAGIVCDNLSLKQVNGGIVRTTKLVAANKVVDKTDKLLITVGSGASNTGYSVRAYLRVIPART